MFDIGWSELFVIAVVAVIVVGPKDLPKMLRTFGNFVARMKRMAGDFQSQFNEALREAELDEVQKSIQEIGKIDPMADLKQGLESAHADIDRELRKPVDEKAHVVSGTPPDPMVEMFSPHTTPPAASAEATAPAAEPEKPPVPASGTT